MGDIQLILEIAGSADHIALINDLDEKEKRTHNSRTIDKLLRLSESDFFSYAQSIGSQKHRVINNFIFKQILLLKHQTMSHDNITKTYCLFGTPISYKFFRNLTTISLGCRAFHYSDPMKLKIICRSPQKDLETIEKTESFRRRVRFETTKQTKAAGKEFVHWQELELLKPNIYSSFCL